MHSLTINLKTPAIDDRPVFITGNFCEWALAIETLQLQQQRPGEYTLELPIDESWPPVLEYKYYRGGEGSLELDEQGEPTPNRSIPRETVHVTDEVPYWQWNGLSVNPAFMPIEEVRYIDYPGSDQPRRVQIVLPYDYESSGRVYPVLYLNDGQNLIGEGQGFGSWLTEVRLAQLASRQHHGVIIVAVDHSGADRLADYTVEAVRPGFGKGRTYLDFLVNVLKPMIDSNFRTLADAVNTGIGGSSLGGLISIWAGLLYPDVFGKWLVFSPSLWISPGIYARAAQQLLQPYTRVYLYGGEAESKSMKANLNRLRANLRCRADACAFLHIAIDPAGLHEERCWSAELPRAIDWLFFNPADETRQEQATQQPANSS
ncbi:alpha/beta hydrolase [Fibrella arboris]|uniref:alpha/beta hydrolase n=1 Tax=Fibrella arboris TaxID=3242486 RepID=UPI003521E784